MKHLLCQGGIVNSNISSAYASSSGPIVFRGAERFLGVLVFAKKEKERELFILCIFP